MSTDASKTGFDGTPREPTNQRALAGVILIVIGVLALVATLSHSEVIGLLVLPGLGLIFLVWGLLARRAGPLVPGAILTGLGLGVVCAQLVFAGAEGTRAGAIVVLGLGLGFLSIIPLTKLVAGDVHPWPVIPGGLLTLIAALLLIGGPALDVLTFLGTIWPVALIAAGIYVLWQVYRHR